MAATSAGITSATFLDLGINARGARTVLGAAVVDDILALLLLSVAVGMAAKGGIDVGEIALSLGISIVFLAFFALGGTRLLQRGPTSCTSRASRSPPCSPRCWSASASPPSPPGSGWRR